MPVFVASTGVLAQTTPTQPPTNAAQSNNGQVYRWAPQSQITVLIDGNYFPSGSDQEKAVIQGMQNDQNAYGPEDGVTYTFQNVTTAPVLTTNQVFVTETTFDDQTTIGLNDATYYFSGPYGYNIVDHATTYVGTAFAAQTSPSGITEDIAHEGSHDEGMGDCPTCVAGSTIMSYQNFYRDSNNVLQPYVTGPTFNDTTVQATADGCQGSPCECNVNNCDSYCSNNPDAAGCQAYNGCPDQCNSACDNYDICACQPDDCDGNCDICDPACDEYDYCACTYEDCFCNPDFC